MKRSKPLALLTGASLLGVAACGGSSGGGSSEGPDREFEAAATEIVKDPDRAAPAAEIEGAEEGGTVTVYIPSPETGPNDLDPTNGWSVAGNSIQQALTHRSLTQYAMNPETGQMELIPDLATDLGTPNDDFTEWTFTIREGVKWEDGSEITPEEVAFGISRSLDAEAFPSGPGTEYSKSYFLDGQDYEGPYTGGQPYEGIEVNGQDITIKMEKPFPDMDWWGAFMAMGPAPEGNASKPPAYGRKPLSNGPYKIESFRPTQELVLVRNDQWDPNTDPGRHQYVDKWIFKFDADPQQTDEILLSGNADSQTAIATSIQAQNYSEAERVLGDNLVQQTAQCVSYDYPVYDKTTPEVRKAMAYAYDYEAIWSATGEIPGVTRVPASGIMPPGMAGRVDFQVEGEQITFDPERAKELLAEAGYGPDNPFEIVYIYDETDPLSVAGMEQRNRGYEEAGFEVRAIPVQVSLYDIWLDPNSDINKQLTLKGVNWCSDWPSGLSMIPPLLRGESPYNTGGFNEPEIEARMDEIPSLPADEQAAAWGELDEQIMTEYFPIIPTAYRNDLFTAGSRIGNFTGDGSIGAPNYKDIFVVSE